MFHSVAFITCALTAFSLAQGEGSASASNSGSGSMSGAWAKKSLPALVTTALAPTPGSSKQLSRCHQSCYQQLSKSPNGWHYCSGPDGTVDCTKCCQNRMSPFELRVLKAQRQVSLVLIDIGWDEAIANASRQCLITWEVSGGGLMGNLLTDTAWAELSLWPDTVYNIQVKCKHRFTGVTRRSIKLNVDTSQLVGTTTTTTSATTRKYQSQKNRNHATDRVYIISALPPASELGGVVFPVFGALTFFLILLVMFLFLRPQRKRFLPDTDTTTLIGRTSLRNSLDSSTLHV